jgi:hypothetical protein
MGLPYLYQHVHDCEHLVVFMDMKAISMADPQTLAEYPIMMNKVTIFKDKDNYVISRPRDEYSVEFVKCIRPYGKRERTKKRTTILVTGVKNVLEAFITRKVI